MSHDSNEFDPLLGWKLQSNLVGPGSFATREHGIRENENDLGIVIYSPPILAVGDSFVVGSEVINVDTWPSQLERLIRIEVLNAGVGGYGFDQSFLRAATLLSLVRPRHVLLGVLADDIERMRFTHYGAPKPYYDAEMNLQLDHLKPKSWTSWIKWDYYKEHPHDHMRALWFILTQVKLWEVPTTIVLQYGAAWNHQAERPPHATTLIEFCQQLSLPLIDEWLTIKQYWPASFPSIYVVQKDGTFGHMSALGNRIVANLIAKELVL